MPINQHSVAISISCHVRVYRARSPLSAPAGASSKENVTLALFFIGLHKSHFIDAIKTICVNMIFMAERYSRIQLYCHWLDCFPCHWVLRMFLICFLFCCCHYEWSGDVPPQIWMGKSCWRGPLMIVLKTKHSHAICGMVSAMTWALWGRVWYCWNANQVPEFGCGLCWSLCGDTPDIESVGDAHATEFMRNAHGTQAHKRWPWWDPVKASTSK